MFCGTCGSALNPAEAKAIVEEETKPTIADGKTDDTVVPGQGGARRDLGTGAAQDKTIPPTDPGPQDPGIVDDETASGGPTIKCGVCGTINDATRTYCRKCASELKTAAAPPPPPPTPVVTRKISPIAIGLGAAAVVVAIVLISVLALGGNKPAASLAPTARASQPAATTAVTALPTVLPTAIARIFSETTRKGHIAFVRCPAGGGDCSVYVQIADASAKSVQVTSPAAGTRDASISNDGKRVVYSVTGGLRIVTIKTKAWVKHSAGVGDSGASWSPNDSQLTFAGFRTRDNTGTDLEIRIDSSGTGDSTTLTNNDAVDTQPVFTPDGKSIIFVEGEGDQAELMLLDIASKAVSNLTTDAFEDRDPIVSADGTEVAFASKRGGSGGFDLFVLDLTTKGITPLPTMTGDERHPAFSPGGRWIIFSGGKAGAQDLFLLDRSTNKVGAFNTAGGADLTPTWR